MDSVVSIIVPVFNGRNYIERCFNSIKQQSLSNIEIIAINDGSSDDSLSLLIELEKNDSRIRVINKSNGGSSSARNVGLKLATAKYLLFVDVDDTIEPDMLEQMVNKAEYYNADIVMSGYNIIENDTINMMLPDKSWGDCWDGQEFHEKISSVLPTGKLNCVWNKLLRRELIENTGIRFNESIHMGEDLYFIVDFLESAKRMAFVYRCLYNYHITAGSLTHRYIENLVYSQKMIRERIVNFACKQKLNQNSFWRNMDELECRDMAQSVMNLIYPGSPLSWRFLVSQLKNIVANYEPKDKKLNIRGVEFNSKMAPIAVFLLKYRLIYILSIVLLLYSLRFQKRQRYD